MTGKTHIMGGVAICVALASITNYDPILLTAAGAAGGLIPDICHRGSKIGRKFPILSKVISVLFGHRTFTHSLLFLVIVGVLLSMFVPIQAVQVGVLVGMVSHLILDAATKNGIKLLYPSKKTVRLPFTTTTGGTVEYIILIGLTMIVVYFGQGVFTNYL
ncbi:metal-dependent hydrolase [Peribacillus castrilensis]|uniref:metal-dependent hydrolase n=1 Tax=Bacillaceae TaxID=186817 RepID=UPI000660EA44|nr:MULTISPECIES: metal-dependent hydrolase [Bacillaceae]MCT1390136.1 metal-dependent hydrolase [Peribacillus frigoritolerans]PRA81585.1 metal-dependent hydrolase [Peribacillus simplex]